MKSQRPYLLRALYEWIVDSEEVPYLLVDANVDGVEVPKEHVQDGQIVLNVGPSAVKDLHVGEDYMMLGSRFNGRHFDIVLPMMAIKAIYCKDSGEGMVFPEETNSQAATPAALTADALKEPGRSEQEASSSDQGPDKGPEDDGKPTLRLV